VPVSAGTKLILFHLLQSVACLFLSPISRNKR